jgi:hypothetical protein
MIGVISDTSEYKQQDTQHNEHLFTSEQGEHFDGHFHRESTGAEST